MKFTVPLVPPSVNHYVKHTRSGRHYVTAEAKAFKDAVALIASSKRDLLPPAREFEVSLFIFLAKGGKGDVDNFCKLPIDALVYAGLLPSDDSVKKLTVQKGRDWQNPRTEIEVIAVLK